MKKVLIRQLLTLIGFFLIWWVLSRLLNTDLFPSPWDIFNRFLAMPKWAILGHFWISTWRVLISLILALTLAVPIGLFLGRNKAVDHLICPMIYLLYPIPKIVLLPLVLLFLGLGDLSKIFIISLIVFFHILVCARDAARSIDTEIVDSMLSLGSNGPQVVRHVIIPSCMPKILTSLRISIGTSIAVLFFVESFANTKGLGYLILDAWGRLDYQMMYIGIIGMGVLGVCLYEFVEIFENRACAWSLR